MIHKTAANGWVLSVERDFWINGGVNEYPVLVDVRDSQIGYPLKVQVGTMQGRGF